MQVTKVSLSDRLAVALFYAMLGAYFKVQCIFLNAGAYRVVCGFNNRGDLQYADLVRHDDDDGKPWKEGH